MDATKTFHDPYIWMENLKDPRVSSWINERNTRTRQVLAPYAEALYPRLLRLLTLPTPIMVRTSRKGLFVLMREREFYIKLVDNEGQRVLVTSTQLGSEIVIHSIDVDRSGSRLAYFYSSKGADEGTLRIIDTGSGEVLDEIHGSVGNVVWLDEDRFYYTRFYRRGRTPDGVEAPAERVFLREDGVDEMVFGEGVGPMHHVYLYEALDGRHMMLTVSYGWTRSTVYIGDKYDPSTWSPIYGGDFVAEPIDCLGQACYILSYEGRGLGRIVMFREGEAEVYIEEWEYPLRWATATRDGLLLNYLVDAAALLRYYRFGARDLQEYRFDPPGSLSPAHSDGETAVFKYTSFTTPYRLYRFASGRLELVEKSEVELDFEVSEDWAVSRDGTRIHMFIVKKRGVRPGKVLLYGYGGFSVPVTPMFYATGVVLVEDGGTLVVTNLRGGSEYGEEWHRAGMRENKQRVFEDYIACAEKLKRQGARIVGLGISNGGLLIGAVITQRPDLLDGAVIGYPVLDMLRFHKLYIGAAWIPEYGDPDDPRDREFLARYSPYHNLRPGAKYPPTLIYTGLHDDRVHPAHALKFAARMEELGAPVLLRVETRSGHSGATPEVRARELADVAAFIYKVLGLRPGGLEGVPGKAATGAEDAVSAPHMEFR